MTDDELYETLAQVMPRQTLDLLLEEERAEARRHEIVRELRRLAMRIRARR